MQLLSNATCVSVNVGFVPPQSLTHVDYLRLEQRAHTSHILWASNQVLGAAEYFSLLTETATRITALITPGNSVWSCSIFSNVLTFSDRGPTWHHVGDERPLRFLSTAKNRRRARGKTWVRGGSAVKGRLAVSERQTKREGERERENPMLVNSPCTRNLLASVQVQVEVCPKAKSFLFFVKAFADVFTVLSLRALSGFYIYLHNI